MFNISINGDIYDCYTFGLEEKVFEAIMASIFPNLIKTINSPIQKAQEIH